MRFTDSIGAKLALVCAACLALLAVTAAAFNAVGVKALQENMRRNSLRLAEEKGRHLASELILLQGETGNLGLDMANSPAPINDLTKLFIKQNDIILMAFIFDHTTKEVISAEWREGSPEDALRLHLPEKISDSLQEEDGRLTYEIEGSPIDLSFRKVPLGLKENPGLSLGFALRDSEIYREIEAEGELITRRVALWTAILSVALIAAFVAVWALFGRQMRLLRENEKLNRMAYVGTLASGLAHEIRNPLNAMSINLEVVEEDLDDPRDDSPQRVREIVNRLRTEVSQLNGSLNNFLTFALPRGGRPERVSLAEAVGEALESLEGEIQAKNVKTSLDLKGSMIMKGDPAGLRQVFHNIVLNAIQAMNGPIRRLQVRGTAGKGSIRMEFEDTGPGIDPQLSETIFEAFQTSKPDGSGFGLPIARRIVEDHGGKIRVEPASGKGARFILEFPLPKNRPSD